MVDDTECVASFVGWLGMILLLVGASSLAATAGIGGGGLYVPLLSIVLRVPEKVCVGLSAALAFGLSITVLALNTKTRDPSNPSKNAVHLRAVGYLEPLTISGTVIGAWINEWFPDSTFSSFSALFLMALAIRTLRKGLERLAYEKNEERETGGNLVGDSIQDEFEEEDNEDEDEGASFIKSRGGKSVQDNAPESILENVQANLALLAPVFLTGGVVFLASATHMPTGLVIVSTIVIGWIGAKRILDQLVTTGEESWTQSEYVSLFPIASALGGVLAGFIGIGGGMIKGPLLLEMLHMHPVSVRLTSSFMVVFTSLSTVAEFYFLAEFSLSFPLVMACIGIVGGVVGDHLGSLGFAKYPSIIVIVMGLIMLLASLLSFFHTAHGDRHLDSMRLFC